MVAERSDTSENQQAKSLSDPHKSGKAGTLLLSVRPGRQDLWYVLGDPHKSGKAGRGSLRTCRTGWNQLVAHKSGKAGRYSREAVLEARNQGDGYD